MTRSLEPMMDFFLREKGDLVHINSVKQLALIRDATDIIQITDEKNYSGSDTFTYRKYRRLSL
ncbi:hypothetical protein [Paenibacillus sp. 8b26]|uniref:hypothetical protein n=1 Tax=Paenibacillus sp. 8b26 TaxID=3424133 RepID=UPI003D65DD5C